MKKLGSAVVVLVAIGGAWAQRTGMFEPKLELTTFHCGSAGAGRIAAWGTVTNISGKPLDAAVAVSVHVPPESSRQLEGPVTPVPLPPGGIGEFRVTGPAPGALYVGYDGQCVVNWFREAGGGRLSYVATGQAATADSAAP